MVPSDPLLAGLAVRTSAAFNSTPAQKGVDPGSACLDNPPSATLQKGPKSIDKTARAEPRSQMYWVKLQLPRRSEDEEKNACAQKWKVRYEKVKVMAKLVKTQYS